MKSVKSTIVLFGLMVAFLTLLPAPVPAQTFSKQDDGTQLKQIILFGRHSVRSTTTPSDVLEAVAVQSYPAFEIKSGYLTPHGRKAAMILGTYFRNYLTHEGLLTGDQQTDMAHSYFRSNSIQRSNVTCAALHTGLFPDATPQVHSYSLGTPDPVFDPIAAGIVQVDADRAVAEVQAMFNSGQALTTSLQAEFAQIRSLLFDYPVGTDPVPDTPAGLVDVTALDIPLTANPVSEQQTGTVINVGGLMAANMAIDPFFMQYVDGFAMDQVGWGRTTQDAIAQQTRIISVLFQIELLTPYLNTLQSSNAASHVLRTMEQAVIGENIPGAFGDATSKTVVVTSSDGYVAGLAGILKLHWLLPGYQPDFCAPAGALVFELRQVQSTGQYIVRVYYTAQTFDQLRNLTPLTQKNPPATQQLLVPGGTTGTSLDVDFFTFQRILLNAINQEYVQPPAQETPPGILTHVPMR